VGGMGVLVGGTGVALGGTGVALGGTGVALGGTGVALGGTGVALGGTGVAVIAAICSSLALANCPQPLSSTAQAIAPRVIRPSLISIASFSALLCMSSGDLACLYHN
jgi:hypothetical protein